MRAHRIFNIVASQRDHRNRKPDTKCRILTWAPNPEEAETARLRYQAQLDDYLSKFDDKTRLEIHSGRAEEPTKKRHEEFAAGLIDTDLIVMLKLHRSVEYHVRATLDDPLARCTCKVTGSQALEDVPVDPDCLYHADDPVEAARRKTTTEETSK